MSNTIFLNTFFPPLQIGIQPEMSSIELDFYLKLNLSQKDYQKVQVLKRPIDIDNIRSYWRKEALLPRGNLSHSELEYALVNYENLPTFIIDYLEQFSDDTTRKANFSYLLHEFYKYQLSVSKGFIKHYLQMERDLRLIFAAFRAKSLGKDITEELQYEDLDDPLVLLILAQKDNPQFDPPEQYEGLKNLFQIHYNSPFMLHKAVEEWKFNHIDTLAYHDQFSLDKTLAYLAQLEIVERWLELDKEQGLQTIDSLVRNIQ